MFSVIIPLYNKAAYIEKAIFSVFSQTFKEFELIVINDGSKDNSLEIVQQINNKSANQQIRIIDQVNQGVSITRNNGVKYAKYDYIAFLDADDWWDIHFLEEIKSLIDEFPEGAIYASSYFKVKNNINIPAKIGISSTFEKGYFDYCRAYASSLWMPLWTGAVVLKKDIFFEMQGFKPHLKLGEDFDLWLRIALKYKITMLNKPLAYYNQDVEQLTRAIGNLHRPENHMLWYLDDFENQSKNIPYLKQLLDKLRVYSLYPYYLNDKYRDLAKQELEKVDWSKQSKSEYRKYYKTPLLYLKVKSKVKSIGVKFKKELFKYFTK